MSRRFDADLGADLRADTGDDDGEEAEVDGEFSENALSPASNGCMGSAANDSIRSASVFAFELEPAADVAERVNDDGFKGDNADDEEDADEAVDDDKADTASEDSKASVVLGTVGIRPLGATTASTVARICAEMAPGSENVGG